MQMQGMGGYEAESKGLFSNKGNRTSESLSFLLKVMQKELRVRFTNEFRLPEF